MRIAGYIDHPIIKITVLQLSERYAIKFEWNMLEQTYKYHDDDQLRTFADVEKLVDEQFLQEVIDRFKAMTQTRMESYKRNII